MNGISLVVLDCIGLVELGSVKLGRVGLGWVGYEVHCGSSIMLVMWISSFRFMTLIFK